MLLKKNNLIKLLLLIFLYFGFFQVSNAANLNLTPNIGSYTVGDTITIRLYVNSPNQAINAVSANLLYSKNVLSLVSISKSSSIINLWAQEPNFSNTNGTATLEGIILTGYTGSSGIVATLVFKAKSAGIAEIKFSSASILANDGEGTNVLNNFSSAVVTVNDKIENKTDITKKPTIVKPKTDIIDKTQNDLVKEDVVDDVNFVYTPVQQGFFDNINLYIAILLLILLIVLIHLINKIIMYRRHTKEHVSDVKKFIKKRFAILKKDNDLEDAEKLIEEKIEDINKL